MAKFHGMVGYGHATETPADSGVFRTTITEVESFGDVVRNTRRLTDGPSVNADISVSTAISIVADEYASDNFFAIKYVTWMGASWRVDQVEPDPDRPRLLLRLGGVYNGPKA